MIKWLEVLSTNRKELTSIAEKYSVHPLAIEDCEHRDQRPKLDDYNTHQLLVWFIFANTRIYELQILIFPDTLIAVPHEPPPDMKTWGEYLRVSEQHRDVWHMLYHALDKATDITSNEIRLLMNKVDQFEQDLFIKDINIQSILLVKKKLNDVDASVGHLSSVANQVMNLCKPMDDLKWKFRDLCDHCERLNRNIALYRSQVVSVIDLYWGMQANRTNRQIKKLTMLASISVPLTFWSSFWGMNFDYIPFARSEFFFVALGIMGLSVLITSWLLVRKGYWSD